MTQNPFNARKEFTTGSGKTAHYFSLPELEKAGLGKISRLPVSIRIVLESVLRNCDGARVEERNVRELAAWQPNGERTSEVPFVVARVLLQDRGLSSAMAYMSQIRSWEPTLTQP